GTRRRPLAFDSHRVLERLEVGPSLGIERDDFAVDHRTIERKLGDRARDARKARGPVLLVSAHETDLPTLDERADPIAVVLDLVDPLIALGRRRDQSRELRPKGARKRAGPRVRRAFELPRDDREHALPGSLSRAA